MARLADRRVFVALASLLLGVAATACGEGEDKPANDGASRATGSIAFVDPSGCIGRVDLGTGTGWEPVCLGPAGVTAVAWIDPNRVAYLTPESERLGWRIFDYSTGIDRAMPGGEAPRVIHAGPVQPISILGDIVEVDSGGEVSVVTGDAKVAVLRSPASAEDQSLPQLLTWSPDGEWVLLENSRDRQLLVVHRTGGGVLEVAGQSRGVASWYMPEAGALPHMDFTCGLPTEASFVCQPYLRDVDGVGQDDTVVLSWLSCSGATGYEVLVSEPGSGTPVIQQVVAGTAYRASIDARFATAGLVWKVRPLIGTVAGTWSTEGIIQAEVSSQ